MDTTRTLVLLHEGLGCTALWKSFPDSLAVSSGCNIFVYSRFGYGGSSGCALPRPVSYMHDEAGYLDDILAQVPGQAIILVGHSDGASIATIFAGRPHNRELQGLVLIAPHFFVEELAVSSIEKLKAVYENTDLGQRMRKYHGDQAADVFRSWNDIWLDPAFRNWNICEYLQRVDVPLLVIQGDDDEYGSTAQVETAVELVKKSVVTRYYADCGHSPHTRYEEEISAEIAGFITGSA
jgi:pimeloyl-ACP methyl ester carboxylesterase